MLGQQWREAMYVSLSKLKSEIGSIVSELNPKLRNTRVLPQTLSQSPQVINHEILQSFLCFEVIYTQKNTKS